MNWVLLAGSKASIVSSKRVVLEIAVGTFGVVTARERSIWFVELNRVLDDAYNVLLRKGLARDR